MKDIVIAIFNGFFMVFGAIVCLGLLEIGDLDFSCLFCIGD